MPNIWWLILKSSYKVKKPFKEVNLGVNIKINVSVGATACTHKDIARLETDAKKIDWA